MQDLVKFFTNHATLSTAALIVFIVLIVVELMRARRGSFAIKPAEVTQKINRDNAVVIDIRSAEVFKKGHIINAISLSASEIKGNPKKVEKYRSKPIIVVCGVGLESSKLAAFLLEKGFNAYALAGGLRTWEEAQMPLTKE